MAKIVSISLHAPWGLFIALGLKTIETRNHKHFAHLVGYQIGIHHARKWDSDVMEKMIQGYYASDDESEETKKRFGLAREWIQKHEKGERIIPMGCFLCTALVKRASELSRKDSAQALCPAEGLFGLHLSVVRRFEDPIRGKGAMGAFSWKTAPKDHLVKFQMGDAVKTDTGLLGEVVHYERYEGTWKYYVRLPNAGILGILESRLEAKA